jgi:hypothetical protein
MLSVLLGLLAGAPQGAPPPAATVVVNYASAIARDTANRGSVTLTVKNG